MKQVVRLFKKSGKDMVRASHLTIIPGRFDSLRSAGEIENIHIVDARRALAPWLDEAKEVYEGTSSLFSAKKRKIWQIEYPLHAAEFCAPKAHGTVILLTK